MDTEINIEKNNITTSLENLLESLLKLKVELFAFIGIEENIEQKKTIAVFNNEHKKWNQERLKLINRHLSTFHISMSVAGYPNLEKYSTQQSYNNINCFELPNIQIKTEKYTIIYCMGVFFNRFFISNSKHDILQIEPELKMYSPLPNEEYQNLQQDVEILTAELTQHNLPTCNVVNN